MIMCHVLIFSETILNTAYMNFFFNVPFFSFISCLNLFCYSYFASEDRYKQLCVNISFEKKTVPLYGLKGRTIQLCEYVLIYLIWNKSGNMCKENSMIKHFAFVCFFSNPTEAKGQKRLSLPAHLVRFGEPPWHVLFYKWGTAAQTGPSWAASCSPGATWVVLSPRGEVPGSLGEETEEEPGGEPLWSIKIRVTSLTFCQGSQGCRTRAAWTGPGRRCVQRDHYLLWRPPAGLTAQRACQSCQD